MDKLEMDQSQKPTVHAITFAVLKGGKSAVLIDYPDEMESSLDGADLDDNCIEGWPKEPGYYEAQAVFWFSQGYCDGYPADGESEWGYKLTEIRRLRAAPATEGSPEEFAAMEQVLIRFQADVKREPDEAKAWRGAAISALQRLRSHPLPKGEAPDLRDHITGMVRFLEDYKAQGHTLLPYSREWVKTAKFLLGEAEAPGTARSQEAVEAACRECDKPRDPVQHAYLCPECLVTGKRCME